MPTFQILKEEIKEEAALEWVSAREAKGIIIEKTNRGF